MPLTGSLYNIILTKHVLLHTFLLVFTECSWGPICFFFSQECISSFQQACKMTVS